MPFSVKQFGRLKPKWNPPPATRGGYTNAFDKTPEAPLTGQVNGLKAAQGEERFARGLNKLMLQGIVRTYYFRSSPGIPKGIPGWKELDFEIFSIYGNIALSIKGAEFVHRGQSKTSQDNLNELIIMERLAKLGRPVKRIETVYDYELKTQEDVAKVLKRLGL